MELFDTLRAAADPARAEPMAAYMRHRFPYLGIPTPERRRLSRPFLQALGKAPLDWDFVATCWGEPEREFQYVGVDYLAGVKARLTPADVPRLAGLITSKSWWDTVDGLDAIVGDIARRYPVVNDTLLAWSTDDNIWLRRAAIDHQLLRKTATGTDLLERIIVNNLGQTEFFITKAIGWALRDYSKTDPEWVRVCLERHGARLAPLSLREASKYL